MMLNTFPPADDDLTYISFKDVSWLQVQLINSSSYPNYIKIVIVIVNCSRLAWMLTTLWTIFRYHNFLTDRVITK